MYKKILIIAAIVLLLVKPATATKGIGIGPIENSITLSPMEEHSLYIVLFNPSDTDSDVNLEVYCTNCIRDYKLLGSYIGKINYTYDFVEVPSSIRVEKNTSQIEGKFVEVKIKMPMFVKNQLILPGNRTFSYYGLTSNIKNMEFKIVASAGDKTKISVVSDLNIEITNNPANVVMYFLIAAAIIIVVYLAARRML